LIHITFVLSAVAIAYTEKLVTSAHKQHWSSNQNLGL
jgi:uncharacterized membrane protein YqhA